MVLGDLAATKKNFTTPRRASGQAPGTKDSKKEELNDADTERKEKMDRMDDMDVMNGRREITAALLCSSFRCRAITC